MVRNITKTLVSSVVGLFLLFSSNAAFAGLFGPSSYDECILDQMKGVSSDAAAKAIIYACAQKFPAKDKPSPKSRELSKAELSNLTGRGGESYGSFSGNIYNGNLSLTVSSITLVVVAKNGKSTIGRNYTTSVHVQPQATGSFYFPIVVGDKGSTYEWDIISARGY